MIEQAKELIAKEGCSVAAVTPDGSIFTGNGATVRPLFRLYSEHKAALRGAAVADRVIGKAAAALLCDAGVVEAFGYLMSESGLTLLQAHGIGASYHTLAPRIDNRDGSDMCPSERAVAASDDAAQCVALVREFLANTPEPKWN